MVSMLPDNPCPKDDKDLRLFNQALLSRQAWWLISFPDNLCAQILKAKYFPNCDLIDAVFPSDSSPTWKAVEYGLQLLKKGLIWRIGDGKKVKIWRDQWILRETSLKLAGQKGRCRMRWVSEPINQEDRSWDVGLIYQVCQPCDVPEILRIKLPQYQSEDFLAWHYEKSGVFSVWSVYKVALKSQLPSNMGASSCSASGERSIWRRFGTQFQIRLRFLLGVWLKVATMCNRITRKMENNAICRICGLEEEDEFHAFISCTRARELRDRLRLEWLLPAEICW
ncbi:hypothetical protein OsJ_23933 [Oryza sativa Japonica Group]|uniref:Uncharacterized protein n=1 Tax=Oryza sativa subsp. japonica TaxID=39947 RepID=B9FWS6_ORYSJ|nr:hypothetical protein OsJ_23933 [Oryza sativa Japonica Group]